LLGRSNRETTWLSECFLSRYTYTPSTNEKISIYPHTTHPTPASPPPRPPPPPLSLSYANTTHCDTHTQQRQMGRATRKVAQSHLACRVRSRITALPFPLSLPSCFLPNRSLFTYCCRFLSISLSLSLSLTHTHSLTVTHSLSLTHKSFLSHTHMCARARARSLSLTLTHYTHYTRTHTHMDEAQTGTIQQHQS